ncbi:MAG: response regulator [Deltaproteobacteria bacterium]|nr:response regulator [Deltaproteobacteria bacterium]
MQPHTPLSVDVLLVEDNPGDRDLVSEYLEQVGGSFRLDYAGSLSEALDKLDASEFDAVLLDLGLPDSVGLDTFTRIHINKPDVPFIVITGLDDERVGIEAVRGGAQDYLVKKHLDPWVVARAIRYAIERHEAALKIEHLNQVLQAVRRVNQLIVREKDPGKLVSQACEILIETYGYSGAWIALGDCTRTSSSLDQAGWGDHLEPLGRNLLEGECPQCRALALKAPDRLVVLDPAVSCTDCALGRCHGHEQVVVTMLCHDDIELGMMAVSLCNQKTIDSEEKALLLEIARDIAFALQNIEIERQRQRDAAERKQIHANLAQSDRLASMGLLAAGVAHEINNPLAFMLYNLESLSEELPELIDSMRRCYGALRDEVGEVPLQLLVGRAFNPAKFDDVIERLADTATGADRIKIIARSLGTFSRVERGEVSEVDLRYAIECAINMACNEIKYRARLVENHGQLPHIMASNGRISQVFLNLLINAAHAIDEGNVEDNEIRIRTWAEGDQVFAEVSDTGRGIPSEHLRKLFEPFFTTKEVGVGSGLGLAICRNIVREFGGEIDVESEVGRGSRFTIRLPVGREEALPPVAEVTPEPATEPAPALAPRGRILVVDDETGIRSAIKSILRDHEVIEASSGEAGKALLLGDQNFDVILCDMMMPGMSGVDLHMWLSAENETLANRMVFITGGAFTPRTREYLSEVGNRVVEKPFDVAGLKKLVTDGVREVKA